MPVPILQGLLTPAEAAEYLGVTPKTLHRWVRAVWTGSSWGTTRPGSDLKTSSS